MLWLQSDPSVSVIGEVLKLGTSGVLAVISIALWRSNQAYAKALQDLTREMFSKAHELEKIPEALERQERATASLEAVIREKIK